MKKIISLLSLTILIFSLLTSCAGPEGQKPPEEVKVRIGYMAGPTGLGMAKMIIDNNGMNGGNDRYEFTKYVDTQTAKADLAAGKVDVICLPTNEAVMYHTQVDNDAKILAINCLNSLYLLTEGNSQVKSLSELDGKTIYTCKNGTPRIVLEHLIGQLKLNITVSYSIDGKEIVTPQDLSNCVILGLIPNAVMPEPLVTSSLLAIKKNGNESIVFTTDIDLNDEWTKTYSTPITMGCIVADGDFARDQKATLNAFLDEYKLSVEYIGNMENIDSAANYVVESSVMGAAPAAKMALKNLSGSISYIDGRNMIEALSAFYNAIGIKPMDDSIYYER